MLNEKTMVVDALTGVNGELTRFGEMIPQTENSFAMNVKCHRKNFIRSHGKKATMFLLKRHPSRKSTT